MKIAVIEDSEKIRSELSIFLKRYSFEIFAPDCFEQIVEEIIKSNSQLVLLDLNLPFYDGNYICRELRKQSDIPIIIVTSRNSEMDELMSLNLGADDFITKPYNLQVLLAHIQSVLGRTYGKNEQESLEFKGVTLNLSKSTVSYLNKEMEVSKNEMRILYLLIKNGEKITKREQIMETLWQNDEFVDENTLTVNINRIRRKLEEIGVREYIKTKRGQGYSL